ncbi:MAG: homocysteine S-methyltransferase family protein, partial [Muribaculaceae bacterium]|nr:homocysteine S-methyltransferase family protein [Muribaculaceae bacterium]
MKILDGAFGTLVQEYTLPEEAYMLDGQDARGCVDVLCLTRPDVVADIHRRYAEAGANIITTNSLCANAFASDRVYDISRRAAELAKATGRFVAGSIGTTSDKPADAYRAHAQGLIDGGADALQLETVTDLRSAREAIAAIRDVSADIPIMISATLDPSGRLYSGQTVEQFCAAMAEARPMSIGLNCGYGPEHLLPYLRRLSAVAPCEVSFHPNAGLPGHYITPVTYTQ